MQIHRKQAVKEEGVRRTEEDYFSFQAITEAAVPLLEELLSGTIRDSLSGATVTLIP